MRRNFWAEYEEMTNNTMLSNSEQTTNFERIERIFHAQ